VKSAKKQTRCKRRDFVILIDDDKFEIRITHNRHFAHILIENRARNLPEGCFLTQGGIGHPWGFPGDPLGPVASSGGLPGAHASTIWRGAAAPAIA